MNKFKKFCENVFIAECDQKHKKGDLIPVTTKYGKDVQCEVYNYLGEKNGVYFYSIVRTDSESYASRKSERYENLAAKSEARSDVWYAKSKEGRDFLVLAEPIKIGHHSEKRHRALIERNSIRMGNSVKESQKARDYQEKADYWKKKESEINLSMPSSIEYYAFKLEEAIKYHSGLKDGSIKREHSYSLQYANKAVKDLQRKKEIAEKLWGKNAI